MRFWDSSAVVPLLVRRASSQRADDWFDADAARVIWTLTPVEITSALWRLVRDGQLREVDALAADERAREFVAASNVITDVEGVKELSLRLLRTHSLRAADALQLAAALVWSGGQPRDRFFLTFDTRLQIAALREGFSSP